MSGHLLKGVKLHLPVPIQKKKIVVSPKNLISQTTKAQVSLGSAVAQW